MLSPLDGFRLSRLHQVPITQTRWRRPSRIFFSKARRCGRSADPLMRKCGVSFWARNRPGHLRQLDAGLGESICGTRHRFNYATRAGRGIDTQTRVDGFNFLDLLAPVERFEASLAALAACGHEVVVFHILDPAEMNFVFGKAALFLGHRIRTRALHRIQCRRGEEYLRKFTAHNAGIESARRNSARRIIG